MKTYIYGAGGTGREFLDLLSRQNLLDPEDITFIDDSSFGSSFCDRKVINFSETRPDSAFVVAIGEPLLREKISKSCIEAGLQLTKIIDSMAAIFESATVSQGVVIYPGARVSSDARVHNNVLVQFNAIIGHDVQIGENTVISSNVSLGGGVIIGKNCFIGMGAVIKEGVSIGSDSIVGMGSVVYKDIPSGVIALGNPARPAKRNENKRVFS